jgi:uncharacterized protein
MPQADFRQAIIDYIRLHAQPAEKFSHQPRLYQLAAQLSEGAPFDDDVLFAAAWMHDLGVFTGHRPENPVALAAWDNTAYAMKETPAILSKLGFPAQKIPAVVECIRTHQPTGKPVSIEGRMLREADILEQLGVVAVLRTVCKIGRDTRFVTFKDALVVLRRNLEQLPAMLELPAARRLAEPRIRALESFLTAAKNETGSVPF